MQDGARARLERARARERERDSETARESEHVFFIFKQNVVRRPPQRSVYRGSTTTTRGALAKSAVSMSAPQQHPLRGEYKGRVTGTVIMSAGRLADIGLQYYLLHNGGQAAAAVLGVPATLSLEYTRALMGMVTVASLRHVYWATVTNGNDLPPGMAASIAVFNALFNSVVSFTAVWMGGQSTDSVTLWSGLALFAGGILFEVVSEEQRRAFKNDPKNKGKPFTKGLNSIVQHPNYFGYTVWRSGLLLATGSYVATAIGTLFNLGTFVFNSVPELQAHNIKKYGAEYKQYTLRTSKLIPFLY